VGKLKESLRACVPRLVHWWIRSLRIEGPPPPESCVIAFWHADLLAGAAWCRGRQVACFVSSSQDGDLWAKCLGLLGFRSVRGSSSRGAQKVRHILSAPEKIWAMAADGPKGPAGVIKKGTPWLACQSAKVLIQPTFRYSWAIRLRTWDRMSIPLPWSKIHLSWTLLEVGESVG
jgi:lysophospholipid acyltransferase (LPLAT)-like uncharacterized protein